MKYFTNVCIITAFLILQFVGFHKKQTKIHNLEQEKLKIEFKLDSTQCRLDSVNNYAKNILLTQASKESDLWEKRLISVIGKPYSYGSMSKKHGFDCSGLVLFALGKKRGGKLGSTASDIYSKLKQKARPERGALVFFSGLSHVGIMISRDTFIHSCCSKGVTISKLDNYWKRKVTGYKYA